MKTRDREARRWLKLAQEAMTRTGGRCDAIQLAMMNLSSSEEESDLAFAAAALRTAAAGVPDRSLAELLLGAAERMEVS